MGLFHWIRRHTPSPDFGAWIDWVKCHTSFHEYEEWSEPRKVDCSQFRKCRRCTKIEERTAHDWSAPSYFEKNNCRKRRVCSRCGLKALDDPVHQWSEWTPYEDSQCDFVRTCKRCGEEDYMEDHAWGVWQHVSPTSCDQVRFCRRCHEGREEKQAEEGDHQWVFDERVRGVGDRYRCTRCSETKVDYTFKGDD